MKTLMPTKEDPKPKKVYKTQTEVDAANDFAKKFSQRDHLVIANDAYVAKKPGDPAVQFTDVQTGQPYDGRYSKMPQNMIKPLPDWVTELGWDHQWNQPYYKDGNDIVYVDRRWYNDPRFTMNQADQDKILQQRAGMTNGLVIK